METVMLKNFVFKKSESGYTLIRYTGEKNLDVLAVPDVVKGRPVTAINPDVFEGVSLLNLKLPLFLLELNLNLAKSDIVTIEMNPLCLSLSTLTISTAEGLTLMLDDHHQIINREYELGVVGTMSSKTGCLYSLISDYLRHSNLKPVDRGDGNFLLPLVPNGDEMLYVASEDIGTGINENEYLHLYYADKTSTGESIEMDKFLMDIAERITHSLLIFDTESDLVFVRHGSGLDCIDYIGDDKQIVVPSMLGGKHVFGVRAETLSQLNLYTIIIEQGVCAIDNALLSGVEVITIPETVVLFKGGIPEDAVVTVVTQENSEAAKSYYGYGDITLEYNGERKLSTYLQALGVPRINHKGRELMATGVIDDLYMGAEIYFNSAVLDFDAPLSDIALVGFHVKLPTDEIVISEEVLSFPSAGLLNSAYTISDIISTHLTELYKEQSQLVLVQ